MTYLRYLSKNYLIESEHLHLGIDDWSWKKGQIYGTLLVDLELRRPIEILPDRREETIEA